MKLLTVGDSFTYGEELSNLTSAWPNLLSDKLGYELNNLAKPGSGNTRMVRQVVEYVHNYDIIIIAWSHFARIEFADEHGIFDTWPGHRGLTFTNNIEFRTELLKYITLHHDDDYLYKQYLINIILTQHLLKANNKKYIMLDAFSNRYVNEIKSNFTDLIEKIDTTYYLGWPDETMMQWTYGTPQGSGGHFLEEGHAIVAEKINEHIRNLGWVS